MDVTKMSTHDPWKVYEDEIPCSTIRYDGQRGFLLDSFQLYHLQLLMASFFSGQSNGQSKKKAGGPNTGASAGTLSMEEFHSTLTTVIGEDCWTSRTEELYKELTSSHDGYLDWEELCSYIVQWHEQSEDPCKAKQVFTTEPKICHCLYNKQQPVTRVVEVSQPPPLRYITVSKGGHLTVWNSHHHMIKSLELCGDPDEKSGSYARFRGWTTDAVYMPNVHKIAVATINKDIHFFDVSASDCIEEFRVFGLGHVATAFCYWYNVKAPGERSVLIWGDEKGSVNLLWFLQPHKGLFEVPFSDQSGPQHVFLPNICGQSLLVSYLQTSKIHNEQINRIKYEPQANLVVTSSESNVGSVIITDVNQSMKSYIWKIDKGVRCFDISWSLNLLVTAGLDSSVRMWNRYVTFRPVAVLQGHRTTVVDILIHEALGKIYSYSKDAVLKIWDIPSQHCMQTMQLCFHSIQAGLAPEQGSFPLLLSLAGEPKLLVTCREYFALLRLCHGTYRSRSQEFSCTLYIPHLKQVVTAFSHSSVVVWDVETGKMRIELKNAHGVEEITAMTTDHNQRRLITAASNGTIKVWNVMNGLILHKLEDVSNTDVTGVICPHDNQVLAVGWSQLVAQYNIGDTQDMYVKADVSWKSGRVHSDDVLAVDHCSCLRLLATGSYNGEIIIWTLDTQRPVTRLQKPQPGKLYPPIDRLLFLQMQAQRKQWRNTALLLSSQAGYICWWSICGPTHNHGQFYVPHRDDECVKGLRTNHDNTLLVTGDTTGYIHMWNISKYGLANGNELANEQPPLVHKWKAHKDAIVSVEIVDHGCQLFLVSVSVDHTACLWTSDGGCVGMFGQEQWNLSDTNTYQINRELACAAHKEDQDRTEFAQTQNIKTMCDITGWGQSSRVMSTVKNSLYENDCEQTESSPNPEDINLILQTSNGACQAEILHTSDLSSSVQWGKVALGVHMTLELQRKTAAKQDRRQMFGTISRTKLCRISNECTPFQVLKTPEMKQLEDVPSRPWMLSGLQSYSQATELSSPLLSSDSSGGSGSLDN